ncbi:putative transmembrane protein [Tieghemostelium lacteum]|uniref:Lipase maturation factor 2 n=1 Tax=Tieghemostelium lacteum TaxID=361077 RepID=A0A152A8B4_TIELA|nr:putative transmembrane protein [Tieghemostelium lacteum]|eukprot:KYR02473.1 putative transmembrane protein [Tieghemostelium lacteum]
MKHSKTSSSNSSKRRVNLNNINSFKNWILSDGSIKFISYSIIVICVTQFILYTCLYRYLVLDRYERSYQLIQSLFVRGIGVIYLCAFYSLKIQVLGLYGKDGILPIKNYLKFIRNENHSFFEQPTLFKYLPFQFKDVYLTSSCNIGLILSLLVILNISTTPCLVALYLIYLSFKTVGGEFFQLQFDNLLLDTGFICILLPPYKIAPFLSLNTTEYYNDCVWWLVQFFNIRLFVASGFCKLTSGDDSWWNGTAMKYHWFTQPMPLSTSFYFQKLPLIVKLASCCFQFIVEILCPILIFCCIYTEINVLLLISLQICILASGNYGIFNLNSILICMAFLKDDNVPHMIRFVYEPFSTVNNFTNLQSSWFSMVFGIFQMGIGEMFIIISVLASIAPFAYSFRSFNHLRIPSLCTKLSSALENFGLFNYYGLFANMTKSRKEILFQGSNDKTEWFDYEFKYKIGSIDRIPTFVVGHLPRLDWRLWFCQFRPFSFYCENWFHLFIYKLLKGEKHVVSLLHSDPFQGKPPKYIRCMIAEYQFNLSPQQAIQEQQLNTNVDRYDYNDDNSSNNLKMKFEYGRWWKRQVPLQPYSPIASISENKKMIYHTD